MVHAWNSSWNQLALNQHSQGIRYIQQTPAIKRISKTYILSYKNDSV